MYDHKLIFTAIGAAELIFFIFKFFRRDNAFKKEEALLLCVVVVSLVVIWGAEGNPDVPMAAGYVLIIAALFVAVHGMLLGMSFGVKSFLGGTGFGNMPLHMKEICSAMEIFAARRTGALIVLEKKDRLEKHVESGIKFDSDVKAEILLAIFSKESPVHDGAILVSHGRIKRVKTVLPIRTVAAIPMGVGTRHRAAVGITEKTDAVCLVASEERGELSVAYKGALVKAASHKEFVKMVQAALRGGKISAKS